MSARLTQGRLRQIIKEELGRMVNEMDMMGGEEEEESEFARRPSEQLLDLEKYAPRIMKNQRLAMYSRGGGFAVTDVVELYAREMARDLKEMGVEVDPDELDRMIHEEVHDMLDILTVEGELNLDPENPSMYTFVRMPKMRRLGPR